MKRTIGPEVVSIPISDRVTLEVETPWTATYRMRGDVLTVRFQAPFPKARIRFGVRWRQVIEGVDVSAQELVVLMPGFPDRRVPL